MWGSTSNRDMEGDICGRERDAKTGTGYAAVVGDGARRTEDGTGVP